MGNTVNHTLQHVLESRPVQPKGGRNPNAMQLLRALKQSLKDESVLAECIANVESKNWQDHKVDFERHSWETYNVDDPVRIVRDDWLKEQQIAIEYSEDPTKFIAKQAEHTAHQETIINKFSSVNQTALRALISQRGFELASSTVKHHLNDTDGNDPLINPKKAAKAARLNAKLETSSAALRSQTATADQKMPPASTEKNSRKP